MEKVIDDAKYVRHAVLRRGPMVFEPAITDCYDGKLGNVPDGGRSYVLRRLAGTQPGDVYRVGHSYWSVACDLIEHFRRTDTSCARPEDLVVSDDFGAAVRKYQNLPADFFMFDQQANMLRPDEQRLQETMRNESKVAFAKTWADSRGLMPDTVVCRRGEELDPGHAWHRVACQPGRVKADFTASGNGNEEFATYERLEHILQQQKWVDGGYVVQRDVGNFEASLTYYLDETGVYFLFSTRQDMAGPCHMGNWVAPDLAPLLRERTDQMALAAWRNGARGYWGYDLMVTSDEGQAWVIECNARITGPAYGWILALKHNAPMWRIKNLKDLKGSTISDVIPPELEFNPSRGSGVICTNPGPIKGERATTVTVLGRCAQEVDDLLQAVTDHAVEHSAEDAEAA